MDKHPCIPKGIERESHMSRRLHPPPPLLSVPLPLLLVHSALYKKSQGGISSL